MGKIAVQLYTVIQDLKSDFLGTVRKAAEIGYEGVEFPGGLLESVDAHELKAVIDETGLQIAGAVFMLDELEEKLPEILEYCQIIGTDVLVFPGVFGIDSEREFREVGKRLDAVGAKLRKHGVNLLYHVHGAEFNRYDGKTGMEILMEELHPNHVNLEVDVYWVEWAGVDSVAFMNKYGDRSPSIHFKDMKDRIKKEDVEVGDGVLDMVEIARIGKQCGAAWFIVEQEGFDMPPMDSIKISCANMRKIRELS